MQSTIQAARRRGHLSRHERQRLARAEAFSRRTAADRRAEVPVKLEAGRARADRPARPPRPDRGVQRAAGDRRDRRRRGDPRSGARAGQRGGPLGAGRGRDQRRARRADRPSREPRARATLRSGSPHDEERARAEHSEARLTSVSAEASSDRRRGPEVRGPAVRLAREPPGGGSLERRLRGRGASLVQRRGQVLRRRLARQEPRAAPVPALPPGPRLAAVLTPRPPGAVSR